MTFEARPLSPPILDHVVVNVMDQLDGALDTYKRLGFTLMPRGYHSLGSANHLAIFGTDYLELLGYEPGGETSRADLWRHPPGLTGLVFKGTDPDARYADLLARGVAVEPPAEFSRPVGAPGGGTQDARFRVLRISPGEVQNGRTFFCHHFTPELVWQSQWQTHPNGVTGVSDFVIASGDPARTAALYERMFGPGVLSPADGGVSFKAGEATVWVQTPEAIARKFGITPELGPDGTDHMVALVYFTRDLAAARSVLDGAGVSHAPYGTGIVVAPAQAAGVITGFVPAA